MKNLKKIIVVTGASSGIGLATAKLLHDQGHIVYGASRNIENTNYSFHKINIDLTKEESITQGIDHILTKEETIDVLINCAGYAQYGAFIELSTMDIRNQFETNFFGHISISQYVLKKCMIRNKSGLIITIGSIGGVIGLPYQGAYSASKFALEGFMESVRMELAILNIRVVLVDPGDICTNIFTNRKRSKPQEKIAVLEGQHEKTLAVIKKDETGGLAPIIIAQKIANILRKKQPKLRYIKGPFLQELAILSKRILPQKWFEKIIQNHYKINY